MLFAPFTRTWWKSLVKGESGADADDPLLLDLGPESTSPGLPEADSDREFNPEASRFESQAGYRIGNRPESGDERDSRRGGRERSRNQSRGESRRAPSEALHHEDDSDEPFTHEGDTSGHAPDDPLAPAFDLDRGAPLPPAAQQPIMEPHVNVKSAKDFFNSEILYRFDILEDRDRKELEGRYRIELKGYQGGIWTVIVKDQVDVFNRREEADIVITMYQRDFLQLVNGHLNPQLAIFAQKMRVQGDLRRCISFDRLLSPFQD